MEAQILHVLRATLTLLIRDSSPQLCRTNFLCKGEKLWVGKKENLIHMSEYMKGGVGNREDKLDTH